MDKKTGSGIIFFALLAFIMVGTATTVYVSTIEEGRNLLGTSQNTELIGCKVYSIQKIATDEKDFNSDWTVKFALEYTYEGEGGRMIQTREGVKTVYVASDTEAAVSAAVEPICDQDWATAQSRYGTVDKVIVEANTNPILNKIYNPISKIWSSLSNSP